MAVEILQDPFSGYQVLICNTTMIAFGDVFYKHEDVESFLEWLPRDARLFTQQQLSQQIDIWRNE